MERCDVGSMSDARVFSRLRNRLWGTIILLPVAVPAPTRAAGPVGVWKAAERGRPIRERAPWGVGHRQRRLAFRAGRRFPLTRPGARRDATGGGGRRGLLAGRWGSVVPHRGRVPVGC